MPFKDASSYHEFNQAVRHGFRYARTKEQETFLKEIHQNQPFKAPGDEIRCCVMASAGWSLLA